MVMADQSIWIFGLFHNLIVFGPWTFFDLFSKLVSLVVLIISILTFIIILVRSKNNAVAVKIVEELSKDYQTSSTMGRYYFFMDFGIDFFEIIALLLFQRIGPLQITFVTIFEIGRLVLFSIARSPINRVLLYRGFFVQGTLILICLL